MLIQTISQNTEFTLRKLLNKLGISPLFYDMLQLRLNPQTI